MDSGGGAGGGQGGHGPSSNFPLGPLMYLAPPEIEAEIEGGVELNGQ